MVKEVEISSFDLRYERCRMRQAASENGLLLSIVEHGIREPLHGVDTERSRILLDGFKRYRCARKLGIGIVPYSSLGGDEAGGIIQLIRIANATSLSILEQARLIDELIRMHKMRVGEIAKLLERSKAWVSMRVGIIGEMSALVMKKLFDGAFPVYAYMYTLRPFIRMNRIKKEEIEEFVTLVSGKQISIRDIELLACGYFKGGEAFREHLRKGNIGWGLSRLKETTNATQGCTELERTMLRDLEMVQKYMQRITGRSKDERLKGNCFHAQANLLAGGVLRCLEPFATAIRRVYDSSRKTQGNSSTS